MERKRMTEKKSDKNEDSKAGNHTADVNYQQFQTNF